MQKGREGVEWHRGAWWEGVEGYKEGVGEGSGEGVDEYGERWWESLGIR